MIKGCQRKIIVIRDTGSDFFDEAYFIIKDGGTIPAGDDDMIAEANRILERNMLCPQFAEEEKKEKRRRESDGNIYLALRWYSFGIATALVILGAALLFL